ncbi:winged helix-turn-helix domain-containing protein [Streptomyces anulatus]|uniref:winged helix-turn-helix domain-containing protein n=1 Tax=Streptomyces anulatus TaxID=1892 RepID=UPI003866FDBE
MQDEITTHVREQVNRGIYGPGDHIPSLEALAAEYSVSVATARRSLSPLLDEGVLITIRPRGTFVANSSADVD